MQISHSSQQVFYHSRLRHTNSSANFHTFYNPAFSIGRVCICCSFHKQGNWAVPSGNPLGIKPFCLLSFFRKVMTATSTLLYPSCNFCSVYVQHWTNDTPPPSPRTKAEVPSPQQPPCGTTEPDRVRDPHKDRPAVVWSSRRATQNWRTKRLVETLPCSSTRNFLNSLHTDARP